MASLFQPDKINKTDTALLLCESCPFEGSRPFGPLSPPGERAGVRAAEKVCAGGRFFSRVTAEIAGGGKDFFYKNGKIVWIQYFLPDGAGGKVGPAAECAVFGLKCRRKAPIM